MIKPCDAVWLVVAAIWSAASPATFQQVYAQPHFDLALEADIDLALGAGDLEALQTQPILDARVRLEAEQVLQSGNRWGLRLAAGGATGDGRRGFSQIFNMGPMRGDRALSGLATGFVTSPGLDAGSGRLALTTGELFLKARWLEWRAGVGPTAAQEFNQAAVSALRITRADRALADLAGGGVSHTGLSLSAPAPRLSVQSRRLVGFSLAVSITPEGVRCGLDICRPGESQDTVSPGLDQIAAIAVSFDRRAPQSGVRWRADMGLEHGETADAVLGYEDPWILTTRLEREHAGITVSLSTLTTNDGLVNGEYRAIAGLVAIERGEWLYSLELAHGRSPAFAVEGSSLSLGASRWVTDHVLVSAGFIMHDAGGAGAIVETGLRF